MSDAPTTAQKPSPEVYADFCLRLHYARTAMNSEAVAKILEEIDMHYINRARESGE